MCIIILHAKNNLLNAWSHLSQLVCKKEIHTTVNLLTKMAVHNVIVAIAMLNFIVSSHAKWITRAGVACRNHLNLGCQATERSKFSITKIYFLWRVQKFKGAMPPTSAISVCMRDYGSCILYL